MHLVLSWVRYCANILCESYHLNVYKIKCCFCYLALSIKLLLKQFPWPSSKRKMKCVCTFGLRPPVTFLKYAELSRACPKSSVFVHSSTGTRNHYNHPWTQMCEHFSLVKGKLYQSNCEQNQWLWEWWLLTYQAWHSVLLVWTTACFGGRNGVLFPTHDSLCRRQAQGSQRFGWIPWNVHLAVLQDEDRQILHFF